MGRGAVLTREAKTDGECGWWERRRRRAESANERGCRSCLLPARRPRTRARRFLGPRRRRPRVFVARFGRSLRTRVLTRPAGKTAHERGDTSNGTSPRRTFYRSRKILRARPYATGTPFGATEELPHDEAHDAPVAAAPQAAPAPERSPICTQSAHHHFECTPPACAVHPRRPLALPTRAALWRRPLA